RGRASSIPPGLIVTHHVGRPPRPLPMWGAQASPATRGGAPGARGRRPTLDWIAALTRGLPRRDSGPRRPAAAATAGAAGRELPRGDMSRVKLTIATTD